jgi:hypothetical protein
MADPTKRVAQMIGLGAVGIGTQLTIVGLLAFRHWAEPQTTWSAMASLATVAAAVVGIWTLVSLRQDSRDRTRPVMIAERRPNVLSDIAELIVRNVGQSVAKNVTFKFDPELPVLEGAEAVGKTTPFLRRRYSRTFPTFGGAQQFAPVPDAAGTPGGITLAEAHPVHPDRGQALPPGHATLSPFIALIAMNRMPRA